MPRPLAGEWQGLCCTCLQLGPRGAGGAQHRAPPSLGAALLRALQLPGLRAALLWLGGARPQGCARSCAGMESRSRGAQGGWQGGGQPGRGAGRKGLPRAGGARQEAAGVGVSVGASASWEPQGKEVEGWGGGPCDSPELLARSGGAPSALTR